MATGRNAQETQAGICETVAALLLPGTYPDGDHAVEMKETHTALVFLTGCHAYKIKKPVRLAFLDFTSLDARHSFCAEEIRLNAQMAPGIYERVMALTRQSDGSLALEGDGQTVEWVLRMRRLPEEDFLENRLKTGSVSRQEIDALGDVLVGFYAHASRQPGPGNAFLDRMRRESEINRDHLRALKRHLDGERHEDLASRCMEFIEKSADEIAGRARAGMIVDGHGDLRPEHVCLTRPPVVFDRLDFCEELRQADPYDEVQYLGIECSLLGTGWILKRLLDRLEASVGHPPSVRLLKTYAAFRMLLRARLSIDHLLDENPRTPEKWPAQARRYLRAADRVLNGHAG